MQAKRQNIQLELALEPVAKGEARRPGGPDPEGPKFAWREPAPNTRRAGGKDAVQPLNSAEPPCTDPYARWCGRGGAVRLPHPDCAEHD